MTQQKDLDKATEQAIDPEAVAAGGEPLGCVVYVADGLAEDRGHYVHLQGESVIVGTSESCDLQLHDSQVSRSHAQFRLEAQGIQFRDLDSTNGTFYLGNRIDSGLLKHGARLRLGRTVIALLPPTDHGEIEPADCTQYGELVGASTAMRRLFAVMRQLEGSEAPVLIHGETGSGKELVARTLHQNSARATGPFAVLDCGAIAHELIDSELFGHVRGAFTGAVATRTGVFEQADKGTLFLDEIGELPKDHQPRLLRVLETGQVRRVGENTYRGVDVRVIAATHRDLKHDVKIGRFRGDLFYRLAVVRVSIPPLRERPEDVPELARFLAAEIVGKSAEPLPDSVLGMMSGYDWPGNVRELRNAVHQLLTLGEVADQTTPTNLSSVSSKVDASAPYKKARQEVVGRFEAEYIRAVLDQHGGNISVAARSAGIARRYFKYLMRKHGLYNEDGTED
ncbi:sigma 54-interacting transcriptional regulator [Myxococcota bacterium]